MMTTAEQSKAAAMAGGLQGWSVNAPYPFVVCAIDNPTGYPPGLYWYVGDSRKGLGFGERRGQATKGPNAATVAHAWADCVYRHEILGDPLADAAEDSGLNAAWRSSRSKQYDTE